MARLDQERQAALSPQRFLFAKLEIERKGFEVSIISDAELQFQLKTGATVRVFPYSGWYSGKGIISERGINNLLKQI